jgi:hypothetical protein
MPFMPAGIISKPLPSNRLKPSANARPIILGTAETDIAAKFAEASTCAR